jgi:hypothetical protein
MKKQLFMLFCVCNWSITRKNGIIEVRGPNRVLLTRTVQRTLHWALYGRLSRGPRLPAGQVYERACLTRSDYGGR